MGEGIVYRRIHRGVLDADLDVLVPDRSTLTGLSFFAQREQCYHNGSFFLTPMQYFSLRKYAAEADSVFDEILVGTFDEKVGERFDQVIDVSQNLVRVFTRPEVDFYADTFERSNGIEAPYVLEIPHKAGFTFSNLDSQTGLPCSWEDNWGKPLPENPEEMVAWEGYRVFNPPEWEDVLESWDVSKLNITPVFSAQGGIDQLSIWPAHTADTASNKIGVRECYLATDENIERFRDHLVG